MAKITKSKFRFNKGLIPAIMFALVAGTIGGYYVGTGHAASGSYIENREGMEITGGGVGSLVKAYGPPGNTYTWINRGTEDCNGGTCWQLKDDTTGHCIAQFLNGSKWMLEEANCDNWIYQWFTHPSSSTTSTSWIFPAGVNYYYGRVHAYALIENSSNNDLYVENGLSANNYDQWHTF